MTLAKEPFDNQDSNIDYAISISQIFPQINRLKMKKKPKFHLTVMVLKVMLVIYMVIVVYQLLVLKD
ncbi:hypothetical protein SD457_02925 [Coprobacillaceae bacterium CR2/5/TPMF4]|nr:hypothetical protein SD457_02925 [Coprobacillaceae bacterium CR2/5/TPMF4]